MSRIVIFGTGDIAEVAHYYFTHDSEHEVVAFTAEGEYVKQETLLGLPVIAFEEALRRFPPGECAMFVAIGYNKLNKVRARVYEMVKERGYSLVSYISSRCTNFAESIGENCFVLEDNTLQPYVKIGNDVTLWSGNHIGHHATIGDHCFITSHVVISGAVKVGPYSFIGVNATTRDHIEIGESNLIGAGALIMKSTQPFELYISQATKPHARRSDEVPLS